MRTSKPKRPVHRTGQAETINPDNIRMHRTVVAGTIVSLSAAVAVSWSGLTFIAGWQLLPPMLLWLTPVMIDVPLIVLTLSRGALTKRGVQARWILWFIIALTAFSSFANIAHTIDGQDATELSVRVGAATNGLAPWLILLLTEVLWLVITKQKPSAAFLKAQAEARAARAKPKRRQRAPRPATAPEAPAAQPEPEPDLSLFDDLETLGIR